MKENDSQENNHAIFSQTFKVRSYEVASDHKATLPSVCDYFQEAAGVHAQRLKFDISQLQEQNLTWVLYKMHVKMNRFPERWNEIEVETWPSSGDGIRAFRDYVLKDSRGNSLGVAISQWMVVNLKNRRPVRMPQAVLDMGINTGRHVIEIDKKPVEPVKEPIHRFLLSVGEYDLDMNNHANNVSYIRWITGYRPDRISAGKKCTDISIQYVSEAVLGDEIYLATEPIGDSPGRYRQTLYKNNDFKVIATAITKWSG